MAPVKPWNADQRRSRHSCCLLIAGVLGVLLNGCSPASPETGPDPLSITGLLGAEAPAGYRRALEPRPILFPPDHGAHPGFRTEWWYFTGNLHTADGRAFGYQFTLFRTAVDPRSPQRPSAWATNQVYLAHAALSDIGEGRFLHDERYSRGALGLAGATAEPLHLWLEDWSLQGSGRPDAFSGTISLAARDFHFRLALRNTRPAVLHGQGGLSAKSATPGNASYYYSYTRLGTTGEVILDDGPHAVTGTSWFDHEWSTSALEQGQAGWDWFSLRLSDGSDLMLFRLRHESGSERDFYSGTLIGAGGAVTVLTPGEISLEATGQWISPLTGIVYPAGWAIGLSGGDTSLRVRPVMPGQELDARLRYWEGSVRAEGETGGRPVSGEGYVELTGYRRQDRALKPE